MRIAAIVPSLNPDKEFQTVIKELVEAGFARIYVVNDGSGPQYQPLFDEAAAYPQCEVLVHPENRGKGRALKTAFERYLEAPEDFLGVVTLDADGQHGTADVVQVAKALEESPDTLILGARNFSQENVPLKSRLGNKLTRGVFRIACGIPISDTQTGLRGIPNDFMQVLMDVEGERYEFETNMLLETKRHRVPVREVPISTIYLNNNAASHFRPLQDGLRIYFLILKFTLSSMTSALLDIGLFALLNTLVLAGLPAAGRLLWATVGARVLSALFNFFMNQKVVFGSKAGTAGAMFRYFLLAAAQMLCSYGGTYLMSEVLPLPAVPAKIIVDVALFFISFWIQRRWVFRTQ